MIKIEHIDKPRTTQIAIACYGDTGRLDRVLRVFHKALTLARERNLEDALTSSLVGLHYLKQGALMVEWDPRVWGTEKTDHGRRPSVYSTIEDAWQEEDEGCGPDRPCRIIHTSSKTELRVFNPET